jgi:hypothetical protein
VGKPQCWSQDKWVNGLDRERWVVLRGWSAYPRTGSWAVSYFQAVGNHLESLDLPKGWVVICNG